MGKETDFIFNVTVRMLFWELGDHETLIIALFLPIVLRRSWKGTWTIHGSDWLCGSFREIELDCKQE